MDQKKYSPEAGMTKNILVPVDYSECSRFACRYAIKIACRTGASVKLFHTYYSPAFDLIELAGAVQTQAHLREEVMVDLEKSEKATIESFIKELQEYADECTENKIDISYEILPGVPEDEIIRLSESFKPDLVVMGTHGKGTGVASIMGSVTAAVIGRIGFPIMAIPEKYTFIGEKNIKNIMYVTEFDESDFLSIKKLIGFAGPLGLNIHCVHLGDDPGAWDKVKMEGLMEYFRKSYGRPDVSYSFLNRKNMLEDLDKLIMELNINILSITSRRQSLFEQLFRTNITKKLFYHTSIPLLVFHG